MPKLIIPQAKSFDGYFGGGASSSGGGASGLLSGGYSCGGSLTPCFSGTALSVAAAAPPLGSPQPGAGSVTPTSLQQQDAQAIGDYLLLEPTERNVYKAVCMNTGEQVVCKVFPLATYRSRLAAYFRVDGHNHVVSIREIVLGKAFAYVIFDRHYGDLHSYVKASRRLKEDEARTLFAQIVAAVAHCHSHGVVVRDLKLRKFVFADPDRKRLVLEGLEQSHVVSEDGDDTLTGTQGCPGYICPEMLASSSPTVLAPAASPLLLAAGAGSVGYSGLSADVWSLGVMLYGMLTGRYPFQEPDAARQFEKIRSGSFTVPSGMTPLARCLVKNLLRHEAAQRPSVADAAHHPWLAAAADACAEEAAAVALRPGMPSALTAACGSLALSDKDQRVPDFDFSFGCNKVEPMDLQSRGEFGDRR